jgi:hypothetical protein
LAFPQGIPGSVLRYYAGNLLRCFVFPVLTRGFCLEEREQEVVFVKKERRPYVISKQEFYQVMGEVTIK